MCYNNTIEGDKMTKIIEYCNNNAFVTSLITLFLSAAITIAINIINRYIDRKSKENDIKRSEFYDRGELRVDKHKQLKYNDRISLIYSGYENKIIDDCGKYIIDEKVLNSGNLDFVRLSITNIGKMAIREIYVVVNNRNLAFLVEEEKIENLAKGEYINFVVPYFNKLLPNESILIFLYFLKDDKIFGEFSSELTIYYMDDYGNCYYQPLFLKSRTLEGPYRIEYKDYRKNTSMIL